MPKVKSVFVVFDGGKTVYKPGDLVSGNVRIDVGAAFKVHGVRVYMFGESLVKWNESSVAALPCKKNVTAKEKYVDIRQTVHGNIDKKAGPPVSLDVSLHKYNFSFRLPNTGLPSSFEGEYGTTRYWIEVELHRPFPWPNINRYEFFTVLEDIDINEAQYQVKEIFSKDRTISKVPGIGNVRELKMKVGLDRRGYCPGEKIAITATYSNSSYKDLGQPIARLIQNCEFIADGSTKTSSKSLNRRLNGSPLRKESTREWKDVLLPVNVIPPSSDPNCSRIIKVSYIVKVIVEVPWGLDLEVDIPVTIGTVPLGHSLVSTASPTMGASSDSVTTCIECNDGVYYFSWSSGIIPCKLYRPHYQFVSNDVHPLTTKKVATGKRETTDLPNASQGLTKPVKTAPTSADKKTSVVSRLNPGLPPTYAEATEGAISKNLQSVLVVMRFPQSNIGVFGHALHANREGIKELGGKLLAMSGEMNIIAGTWNKDQAIAMFVFTSSEKAEEFVGYNWIPTHDSFMTRMTGKINEEKTLFTLHVSALRLEEKCAKNPTLQAKVNSVTGILKPVRLAMGCTTLAVTRSWQMIRGHWLTPGENVRIHQWNNDQSRQQYERTALMSTHVCLLAENTTPEVMSDNTLMLSRFLAISFRHKSEFIAPKNSPLADGPVCLIVRFPENRIRQMRIFFKENWEIVDEMDGVPLAFAPKINLSVKPNAWPAEMALFFVMFPKANYARECYTKLNEIGVNNELTTCDVLLPEMIQNIEIQEEFNFFTVGQAVKTDAVERKANKERFAPFIDRQEKLRKIRLEFGGKRLISEEPKQLHGSWKKANESIALFQWPSPDIYNQYENARKISHHEKIGKESALCPSYLKTIWSGKFASCSLFDEIEEDGVIEINENLKDHAV